MRATNKFLLASFLVLYIWTLFLFLAWIWLGAGIAFLIFLSTISISLLGLLLFLAGPVIKVKRLYSVQPPRAVYDSFSMIDGYCRLGDISKWFLLAVKCGEDHMFFNHKGIDFDCLLNAVASDIFDKKAVGGSTITQQLIKNLYLTPEKSVSRKLCEIIMVGRMERELSKNEIFELYVNVINYGFGKYGISSAAEHYYHCTPAELSFDQSLSLAAILPCPDKYNAKANPVYFYQVRQNLLRKILSFSPLKFNQVAELLGMSIVRTGEKNDRPQI